MGVAIKLFIIHLICRYFVSLSNSPYWNASALAVRVVVVSGSGRLVWKSHRSCSGIGGQPEIRSSETFSKTKENTN